MSKRRQNFQNIAWFLDLYKREKLNLSPPYQRRSVWNQAYREQFVDTILLDYPAPAIFLFPITDESGSSKYDLVDGKQRLTTIFSFIGNDFPVSESSEVQAHSGKYFVKLPPETKVAFFEYDFSVEYLPTNNPQVINDIFFRLNKNVAKLSPQELRHAQFDGLFINETEDLTEWMQQQLGLKLPRITDQSRKQMKDVEMVATLFLFLEEGAKSYSVLALDEAFSERDVEWEKKSATTAEFRSVIEQITQLAREPNDFLTNSRYRNQGDFYSLFGAFAELMREKSLPADLPLIGKRLSEFLDVLENEEKRQSIKEVGQYWDASRSSTNDSGPRQTRIRVIKKVMKGEALNGGQQ